MERRDPAPSTEASPVSPAMESSTSAWAAGRHSIAWLLVVMVVALIVVLLLLLWSLGSVGQPEFSSQESGLEPVLVVQGPGEGELPQFSRPLAAAWGPQGEIYVSDTGNARVCVFDGNGRFLREFGRARKGMSSRELAQTLIQPAGIAVAADGTVYVADLRRDAVLVFDDEDDYVEAIEATRGGRPVDVAVQDEQLAVAGAKSITVLSTDGDVVATIDAAASGAPLSRPNGVAFLSTDELVVSDTNNARVVRVALDGAVKWVSTGDLGGRPTGLPRGISVGSDGSALYADAFRFGLVRVGADGSPGGIYGKRGAQPAMFEFPNDVDMRDDTALVTDKDNGRIQVVRLLGWPQAGGTLTATE